MPCRAIETHCQAVGSKRPIVFDWTSACANYWVAGEVRAVDEVIRPSTPNGFQYRYTAGGQTGGKEPGFPKTAEIIGKTYPDGAAELTAELISNESLHKTIVSSSWEDVDGLNIDGQGEQKANGEQKTWAYVSGDTPGTYRVRNTVTFSSPGEIDVGEIDLDVE